MKKYVIMLNIVLLMLISCNNSTEVISDKIIVYDYQPFKEGTKSVILKETATLSFIDNLPRLDGATALYPLYAAFVQAVYPEGDYFPYEKDNFETYKRSLVGVNTTSFAYNNLINGYVDIIFCAKPSEEQIEMANEKGIKLYMTPIGKEAFVFFVNPRNSVSNLTIEQIKDIYSGKLINWNVLGGRNEKIKVFQRPKNSGSQTMLISIMDGIKVIEPITEIEIDYFMLGIIKRTADYKNYRNAIGYSFLFYSTKMVQNENIKLLSINNIFPSKKTIQNDTYPYSVLFYAITNNKENENVNKFIEWILSEQGQYLVEQTGYVPINR
jgi:phosphate transport system substrate-binding protein